MSINEKKEKTKQFYIGFFVIVFFLFDGSALDWNICGFDMCAD